MPSSKERVVKKRLADGTIKEYRYAREKPKAPPSANSFASLLAAYKRSPRFKALKPSTKLLCLHHIKSLEVLAHYDVSQIRRRNLLTIRDTIADVSGNASANQASTVAAAIFSWALDNEWVETSPASQIRRLPIGTWIAWSAAEADKAQETFSEPLRRFIILARYTGQRRGDLIKMKWADYDGTMIRVVQEKTGARLIVPVHARLKDAMDQWKGAVGSEFILTKEDGTPWDGRILTKRICRAVESAQMRKGLAVHGLRKLAATALAEAGCSVHEIAAITGHKSLGMVSLYTASADQERLARSAIEKMQNTKLKPVSEREGN